MSNDADRLHDAIKTVTYAIEQLQTRLTPEAWVNSYISLIWVNSYISLIAEGFSVLLPYLSDITIKESLCYGAEQASLGDGPWETIINRQDILNQEVQTLHHAGTDINILLQVVYSLLQFVDPIQAPILYQSVLKKLHLDAIGIQGPNLEMVEEK